MTTMCTLFTHFAHCFFVQCIWPLCRAKSSSLNIFNLILYCGRLNDLYEMPNTKRKHKASGSQSIAADTDTSIQIQIQTAIDTFVQRLHRAMHNRCTIYRLYSRINASIVYQLIYVCVYVHVYTYVYMQVCIFVCVCVCVLPHICG